MPFPRFRLALFVMITTAFTQCSPKKTNNLLNYLNSHYKNKLDVKSLVGNRPIINFDIKNDKALLTVTPPPGTADGKCFYIIIDIPKRKILNTIISPVTYYGARYDLKGDSIFCMSAFKPDEIFIIHTKTGKTRVLHTADNSFALGKIITFDKFILLTNSLYGSSLINRATGQLTEWENKSVSNEHAVAFPLSNSINLLSGIKYENDSLNLFAIDQKGEEVWNSKIKLFDDRRFNVKPLEILRIGNYFIVRNSSQLLALDVESGNRIWHKTFSTHTTNALLWNEKILLFTWTHPDTWPDGKEPLQQMNLKLIEPTTGNELWHKDLSVRGYVKVTPIQNDVIITTVDAMKILNEKGALKKNTVIQDEDSEVKIDEINGKSYALYNGNILYW